MVLWLGGKLIIMIQLLWEGSLYSGHGVSSLGSKNLSLEISFLPSLIHGLVE